MFDRMHAMMVASALNPRMEIRVTINSCLSVNLFLVSGFTKFSEKIAAGAKMAELVVLMMADKSEPKKSI